VNAGTVRFNVSWKNTGMPTLWSDTVWVFVDYNNAGKMERLPVTGATASAGTVTKIPDNDKGVWVAGDARTQGSFSATVQLITTVTEIAGACAYASNYPPVAKYNIAVENISISFTGTPPYELVLNTSSGTTSAQAYSTHNLFAGQTLQSFTDKTGAPGTFTCIPMSGNIDFSASPYIIKNQLATFTVNKNPTVPPAAAVTYTWSAPGFSPDAHTGIPYTPTAPSSSGTFPVILTAYSEGYCDLSVTKGVVVCDYELCAVSAQTWMIDKQTWSAPLMKAQAGCTDVTDLGTTNPPTSALYRSSGLYSGSGYLYNWKCVYENSDTANPNSLCPSPWRVPTRSDFITLDKALGGPGYNRVGESPEWIRNNYVGAWGSAYGGGASDNHFSFGDQHAFYWAKDGTGAEGECMVHRADGVVYTSDSRFARYGFQVRCVK
jgi:uncharacterized protein (TIGR02145 family)